MKKSFHISELIVKQIKGNLSKEEKLELDSWINESEENKTTYLSSIDKQQHLSKLTTYQQYNNEKAWSNIEEELFATKTISLFSRRIMKYAAAIAIPLMILGGVGYLYFNQIPHSNLAKLDDEFKPGVQKATLILSDGSSETLGSEDSKTALMEGTIAINNTDHTLTYAGSSDTIAQFKEAIYHELLTPRGGGYNLTLADGSEVWLNAGSSLRFPAAFTDSTRHLYLEGEAYFKVAHNGQPFIVSSGEMDIRVMGTSFNISAYQEDELMSTTLVEGKVRVEYQVSDDQPKTTQILSPNEQVIVNIDQGELSLKTVNASQYVSWVQGKLEFNNEPLDQVLKKLARWYQFEYVYENEEARNYHFTGRLENTEQISVILEMLEMTTDVEFKVSGDQIIVQ